MFQIGTDPTYFAGGAGFESTAGGVLDVITSRHSVLGVR